MSSIKDLLIVHLKNSHNTRHALIVGIQAKGNFRLHGMLFFEGAISWDTYDL